MNIRVADIIAETLVEAGIENVYMLTGGAAMHLNDALGNKKEIKTYHLHHEQSCAIAAESHARHSYKPAVVNVTAGPGAINALNGVFGAYVDSIPMIIISGQAKTSTLVSNYSDKSLRQLGDQEVDICHASAKMTKYSIQLTDPNKVKYELEKCIFLSTNGRPGPCWLDIPIDVQGAYINPRQLIGFDSASEKLKIRNEYKLEYNLPILIEKIKGARRPLIYAGSGIRASSTHDKLITFAEKYMIPIATSWNSNDLIWDNHKLNAGRPGTVGTRAGNYCVQTCDVLIVLGTRLNIRQISYNWECFADQAWICHVDIDDSELDKPTLNQDLKIQSCLKEFFSAIEKELTDEKLEEKCTKWTKWVEWINQVRIKYDNYYDISKEVNIEGKICPYFFTHQLTKRLEEGDTVVFADGTACVAGFQAAEIKKGQRLYHNSGCASMGYELPAAIGAYNSTNKKVYCIAGDGSIMMNLQDLASIASESMPITIFIMDNKGYHSIRQTQNNFFPNRTVGCGEDSGLIFPNFKKLAEGFNIKSIEVELNSKLEETINYAINYTKPLIVILKLDMNIPFRPKVTSKRLEDGTMVTARLEDMSPFLPRDTHKEILDRGRNL